jgi:hypothetical protein
MTRGVKYGNVNKLPNESVKAVPPKLEPRANPSRLQRGFQKLGLKIAHALNIKCEIAPPRTDRGVKTTRQQNFLVELSQDNMSSMRTFMTLADAIEHGLSPLAEWHLDADHNINHHQLYRLFANTKSHGEIMTVLRDQIREMEETSDRKDQEDVLLDHLKSMRDTLRSMIDAVKEQSLKQGVKLGSDHVVVREQEEELLKNALQAAWNWAAKGNTASPAMLLKTELHRVRNDHLASSGTREQKALLKEVGRARDTVQRMGWERLWPLEKLLERGLRMAGAPTKDAAATVAALRKVENKKELLTLCDRLFAALSDQVDGLRFGNEALIQAVSDIKALEEKIPEIPELAKVDTKQGVLIAIDNLARLAGGEDASLEDFKNAVTAFLWNQEFRGEWAKAFRAHADELHLEGNLKGRNARVLDIMREVLRNPKIFDELHKPISLSAPGTAK